MRWPRNLVILVIAVILLALGQELWTGFAPEFLRALGANVIALGLFGSLQDFFRAAYYYPGGILNDRFGMRWALVLANAAAGLGYLAYLFAPNFVVVFLGLPFVMLWPAFVLPTSLDLIGEALPPNRRLGGYVLEETVTKLPALLAPVVGGALIVWFGSVTLGVRIGLGLTLVVAFVALLMQSLGYKSESSQRQWISPLALWREIPGGLKRLLVSEVLTGYAEALPRVLIVLYAMETMHASALGFGLMLAVQALTAIAVNGPLRQMVNWVGAKPVLLVSFLATALFPISVFYAPGWGWLFASFALSGLQAAGATTRKAVITDLTLPQHMGQQVGLYESVLSLAVLPAGFMGGVLWLFVGVWSTFWLALLLGLAGCVFFALAGPAARLPDQE